MPDNAPPPLRDLVPQEFHDKGYLKDLLDKPQGPDTMAAVFKKLDGAETLIGRKIGIPAADAAPDEVEKFYSALRPQTPDEYEMPVDDKSDADLAREIKTAMHEGRLSKHQAKLFLGALYPSIQRRREAVMAAQKEQDAAFGQIVEQTFGPDNVKVLEQVQTALKEHTPDALKPHLARLKNEDLAILIGVTHSILKKYASEDQLSGRGGAGGGAGPQTLAELKAAGEALMKTPAYRDAFSPEHQATVEKVQAIFQKAGALSGAGA